MEDTISWEGYNFSVKKFKWLEDEEKLPKDFLWPDPKNKELREQILPAFEQLYLKFSLAQILDPSGLTLKEESFRQEAVKTWLIIDDANTKNPGIKLLDEMFPIEDYSLYEYDYAIRFLVSLRVFIRKVAQQRSELHPAGGKLSKQIKLIPFVFIPFALDGHVIYETALTIPTIRRNINNLLNIFSKRALVESRYKFDEDKEVTFQLGQKALDCIRKDMGDEFLEAWKNACSDNSSKPCQRITKDNPISPQTLTKYLEVKKTKEAVNQKIDIASMFVDGLRHWGYTGDLTNLHDFGQHLLKFVDVNALNKFLKSDSKVAHEACDELLGPFLNKDRWDLVAACGISFLWNLILCGYKQYGKINANKLLLIVKTHYNLESHNAIEKMKTLPRVPENWLRQLDLESLQGIVVQTELDNHFKNYAPSQDTALDQYNEFIHVELNYVEVSAILTLAVILSIQGEETKGIHWEYTNIHVANMMYLTFTSVLPTLYKVLPEGTCKKLYDEVLKRAALETTNYAYNNLFKNNCTI